MPSDFDPKQVKLDFDLPTEPVEAPIAAGQKLGAVTLTYQGVEYGALDMVAMDSVERSEFLYTIQQVEYYWGQWWVKALVAAGVVAVVTLVVFVTVVLPKRKARRRYSRAGGGRRAGSNYRGRR